MHSIRVSSSSKMAVWLEHHSFSAVSSAARCIKRPAATLLTVSVMACVIVLPLLLSSLLANLQFLAGPIQQTRDINVYLKESTTDVRRDTIIQQLRQRPDVASLTMRTPQQGVDELREHVPIDSALRVLGSNPLPTLLIVTPKPHASEAGILASIQQQPEVMTVQYDRLWLDRLEKWLDLGKSIVHIAWSLFAIAAILVVGNTIRLELHARREEITILRLLGASDRFICRPYLYLGMWYGLLAGICTLVIYTIITHALSIPVQQLAQSYASSFQLRLLNLIHSMGILGVTVLLGWLGSWIVTRHFLHRALLAEME